MGYTRLRCFAYLAALAGCAPAPAPASTPAPSSEIRPTVAPEMVVLPPTGGEAAPEPAPFFEGDPLSERDPLPVVEVQPVTVGPKHAPAVYQRVIRRHRARLRRCHTQALARDSEVSATILELEIAANGAVIAAEAQGAADDVYRECLETAVLAMRFPAHGGGGSLHVRYPLNVGAP